MHLCQLRVLKNQSPPKLEKKLWIIPSKICKKYALQCTLFALYTMTMYILHKARRGELQKITKIYMLLYISVST